jgi:protein-arginine kinase activator protein McsA
VSEVLLLRVWLEHQLLSAISQQDFAQAAALKNQIDRLR